MSGLQLQNFALGIVARRPQLGSALLFVFWAPLYGPSTPPSAASPLLVPRYGRPGRLPVYDLNCYLGAIFTDYVLFTFH